MNAADRPQRVLIGSPARGLLSNARGSEVPAGTIILDLGADHPSRAGLLELRIWTADDRVQRCEVVIGALHRGAEKLYEVRDYRQIIMLADRHDWHAPFTGELGVALLCEQQLGLEVPARATWLRTLLAEQTRIASHLAFLGYLSHRLPGCPDTFPLRELIRNQTQALTGNRVHPMINQIGGLSVDAPADWLTEARSTATAAADLAARLTEAIGNAGHRLPPDLAVVEPHLVHAYGISGPIARAAGVAADLRRDQPYLAYADLSELLTAIPSDRRDAVGRFTMLAAEVGQSAALMSACADRLAELSGPVAVKLGKIVRLPEGDGYLATEGPLGRSGYYLVSRGEKTPWRLKLRTASFNNVAGWERVLPGCPVAELETALASLGYVIGDLDK